MIPSSSAGLRAAVIAALGADAVPRAVLRERLQAPPFERHDLADLDRLLQLDTIFDEVAAGVVYRPAVLEGTSWTARIDADDGAEGFVRLHPHLEALGWWLIEDGADLVGDDGERIGSITTDGRMLDGVDTDVILGPPGWLEGLLGKLARVDVVGGALRIAPIDDAPAATPASIAAMRVGFERAVEATAGYDRGDGEHPPDGRFVTTESVVDEAVVADRQAFRDGPIPLLPDLFAAAGFVLDGRLVAEPDFDWAALRAWQRRGVLRISGGLDVDQAAAAAAALDAFDAFGASTEDDAGVAAAALEDSDVARAVWHELIAADVPEGELARFADRLEAAAPDAIGVAWLRARVLDDADQAPEAMALLEAAVDDQCGHRGALVDLAALRSDRGDAPGALALLVRADVVECEHDDNAPAAQDGHELWHEVVAFATQRPRMPVGRNDRCPCGSGRKYKACHLGRETHSLQDRSEWLFGKARRFLTRRYPAVADDLTSDIVDRWAQRDVYEQLVDSPFIADVALHELGVFAEFIESRGGLLPDDEALLSAQWQLTDRGLFEVTRRGHDEIGLRNVATGDRITVVNAKPGRSMTRGAMLVGRPLPIGDVSRALSGFLPVPISFLDRVLEALDAGGSEPLVDVLSEMLAPPRLQNTDGDPLQLRTMV